MPYQRPFGYNLSGFFPDDVDVECIELLNRDEEGAGLDCFSRFSFVVLCVKCKGIVAFSFSF
jgi:hypothetical protein